MLKVGYWIGEETEWMDLLYYIIIISESDTGGRQLFIDEEHPPVELCGLVNCATDKNVPTERQADCLQTSLCVLYGLVFLANSPFIAHSYLPGHVQVDTYCFSICSI